MLWHHHGLPAVCVLSQLHFWEQQKLAGGIWGPQPGTAVSLLCGWSTRAQPPGPRSPRLSKSHAYELAWVKPLTRDGGHLNPRQVCHPIVRCCRRQLHPSPCCRGERRDAGLSHTPSCTDSWPPGCMRTACPIRPPTFYPGLVLLLQSPIPRPLTSGLPASGPRGHPRHFPTTAHGLSWEEARQLESGT